MLLLHFFFFPSILLGIRTYSILIACGYQILMYLRQNISVASLSSQIAGDLPVLVLPNRTFCNMVAIGCLSLLSTSTTASASEDLNF